MNQNESRTVIPLRNNQQETKPLNLSRLLKSGVMGQGFTDEALVHPCVINNVQTLVYPHKLAKHNPYAFSIIKQYAEVNGFILKEDQRPNFLEGVRRVRDKKLANVISITSGMLGKKKTGKDALVHPCVINGVQTLIYPRGLQESDAESFRIIKEYARVNGIVLKEDQRDDFLEGVKRVKDKQLANVVSVMALSATLGLMPQAAAAESNTTKGFKLPFFNVSAVTQQANVHDIDLDSYKTDTELAQALLDWLDHHSSFELGDIQVPKIKKTTSYEIASVAFGGKIPKAIDPDSLKIFGLYNFNAKTVYLLDSVDLDTTEGKGILLHELVHYLQYETGINKDAKCMNELEALAYRLEARFLDKQHHRHGINESHIEKISQCRV